MHSATAKPDGLKYWVLTVGWAVLIATGLVCGGTADALAGSCLEVTGPTADRPIVWHERFDNEAALRREGIALCVHLSAPRLVRITIDGPGLSTVGHVRFPDGHEEGAPGGPFFDESIGAGDYVITIEQRWERWKTGPVEVTLEAR